MRHLATLALLASIAVAAPAAAEPGPADGTADKAANEAAADKAAADKATADKAAADKAAADKAAADKAAADKEAAAKKAPAKPAVPVRWRSVRFTSSPPNAAVYLKDATDRREILGYTPFRGKLAEGARELVFALDGHADRTVTLAVDRRTRVVEGLLEPRRLATIQVSAAADPSLKGATIFVDGLEIGVAPVAKQLEPGRYLIEVARPERSRFKIWLDVADGERLVLAPVLGVVTASPAAASADERKPKVYSLKPKPAVAPASPTPTADSPASAAPADPSGAAQRTPPAPPDAATEADSANSAIPPDGTEAPTAVVTDAAMAPTVSAAPTEIVAIGAQAAVAPPVPALAATASRLTIEANVSEAAVEVDGEFVGEAPLAIDVKPGNHTVIVTRAGHIPFDLVVSAEAGGESAIRAVLNPIDMAALEHDVEESREAESLENHMAMALGALPLRRGQLATTAALGYPHYLDAGIALGVGRATSRLWDVRVGVRTSFTTWDAYGGLRVGLLNSGPWSLGVQARAGGGAGSAAKRSLWVDGGIHGSVVVSDLFSLSGGMTLEAWSDRICPPASMDGVSTEGPRVCTADATEQDRSRAADILGADSVEMLDLSRRDLGARVVFSAAVDVPIDSRWSAFGLLSLAPGQEERALHTDLFNSPMLEGDRGLSLNLGAMARF